MKPPETIVKPAWARMTRPTARARSPWMSSRKADLPDRGGSFGAWTSGEGQLMVTVTTLETLPESVSSIRKRVSPLWPVIT